MCTRSLRLGFARRLGWPSRLLAGPEKLVNRNIVLKKGQAFDFSIAIEMEQNADHLVLKVPSS